MMKMISNFKKSMVLANDQEIHLSLISNGE
jgi:hypothetical protein